MSRARDRHPDEGETTAGYLNSALARREAMDNGYAEAILLTEEGHVSEGSAEHVFMVRDGRLISPPSTATTWTASHARA